MFNNICIVIATKDRPKKLRSVLQSLVDQTQKPFEVIIVDGSEKATADFLNDFTKLKIKYKKLWPPSAARQRNFGIRAVSKDCDFIGLVDDDVVLEKRALENMMAFWKIADENVGGAAFNLINHPEIYAEKFKSMGITEKLGLYSKTGGKVTVAGFQTLVGRVKRNKIVDWISSGAAVWRKHIFKSYGFDEWYTGYSYLEDLDFSYTVSRRYKLAVVADAGYCHYPGSGGRGTGYEFGVREVLNRLYFVKRHEELSVLKCFLALKIRQLMSVWLFLKGQKFYFLARAFGNSVGFIKSILNDK